MLPSLLIVPIYVHGGSPLFSIDLSSTIPSKPEGSHLAVGRFGGLGFIRGVGLGNGSGEDIQFSCPRNSLYAVAYLEFAANLAAVPFDCADGENEPVGNLTVGHSLRHQLKDFKFSFGQQTGFQITGRSSTMRRRSLNGTGNALQMGEEWRSVKQINSLIESGGLPFFQG